MHTSMEYTRTSIIIRNGTNPIKQQKAIRFRPRPRLLQLTPPTRATPSRTCI